MESDGGNTYYMRSWPPGRLGQPLEDDEVRITALYISDQALCISKVVLVVTFLVQSISAEMLASGAALRESYSTNAVPIVAPIDFSDQHTPFERSGLTARNATGNKMILASVVNVRHDGANKKSFRPGNHDFVVAGIVVGCDMPDCVRRAYETAEERLYNQVQMSLVSKLASQVGQLPSEKQLSLCGGDKGTTNVAANALHAARMACDVLSPSGLLDLIACPVAEGALPDDFLNPLSLPLVLAFITRIAAKPHMYSLHPGTGNDMVAAKELSSIFESRYSPVLRDQDGEMLWAIDVCGNVALTQIRTQTAMKRKKAERECDEKCIDDAINVLFITACGMLVDVMTPTVSESLYTDFGFADALAGPIEVARAKVLSTRGLGRIAGNIAVHRVSSRAARQRVLIDMLCSVEDFLRTGKCHGVQMASPVAAGDQSAPPTDSDGFPNIPSWKDTDIEQALCKITSRDAFFQAREQLQNLLLRGPMVLNALSFTTYIASKHSKVRCVECGAEIEIFSGVCFAQMSSECNSCCGKRCWTCSMSVEASALFECRLCRLATPTATGI